MTEEFKKPEIGSIYKSDRARLCIAGYISYPEDHPNNCLVIYYLDGKRNTVNFNELKYLLNSIIPLC